MKNISLNELFNKKQKLFDFEREWKECFGCPSKAGIWMIWGNSGNGKTTFAMQLAKYLCSFEKVLYNSLEQGDTPSFIKQLKENGMEEVKDRFFVTSVQSQELGERLQKRGSQKVVIIDSVQLFDVDIREVRRLRDENPTKLFIYVSQCEANKPTGRTAIKIMYEADLKILVSGFKALSKGRYGGDAPFVINQEKASKFWGENKENHE